MSRIDRTDGPSGEVSTALSQGESQAGAQRPDIRRRRLVQGAAIAVPTILTLRSGGVAAASICPGQVAGTGNVEKDTGQIIDYDKVTQNLHEGDICVVSSGEPPYCDGSTTNIDGLGSGDKWKGPLKKVSGKYYCADYIPSGDNKTAYILTHSSAASLV